MTEQWTARRERAHRRMVADNVARGYRNIAMGQTAEVVAHREACKAYFRKGD